MSAQALRLASDAGPSPRVRVGSPFLYLGRAGLGASQVRGSWSLQQQQELEVQVQQEDQGEGEKVNCRCKRHIRSTCTSERLELQRGTP